MGQSVAETIFQILTTFFAHYGYWTIFLGVMLENGGVPVPGETVLLFAGFLAYQGEINLERAIITGIVGATIGDSLGYCLGRFGGSAFIEKYRIRLSFFRKHFDRAQTHYLKHGQWAVFVARFITGLRMFSGIIAGSFRMPFLRFFFFNFTGAVVWSTAVCCVGFVFGSNWERLVYWVERFNRIILMTAIIAVVAGLILYYWQKKKSDAINRK
jgi:membrane-associated protein